MTTNFGPVKNTGSNATEVIIEVAFKTVSHTPVGINIVNVKIGEVTSTELTLNVLPTNINMTVNYFLYSC